MTRRTDADTRSDNRIRSLDQFRGFTVLAMFAVNFLHGMEAIPRLFQHNENWFSLADWIMPAFLFTVGMSFRLTWLKRIEKSDTRFLRIGYVQRSLALIAVSLIAYGFGSAFSTWQTVNVATVRDFIAALLKARLWEVLAIIAATQLMVLPLIGKGTRFRMAAAVGLLILHAILSQIFNVHFVLAKPNVLDAFWGAAGQRAWDGGFFGLIAWAAIVLAGTVAYDWMTGLPQRRAVRKLLIAGVLGLLCGYSLSCLSTLYNVPEEMKGTLQAIAKSPVIPPLADGGGWSMAEPPFTPIPSPESRQVNYWMMSKRLVTIPFVIFATGFVSLALAGFILLCDRRSLGGLGGLGGLEVPVFRTLGQNALAAYLLHYLVAKALAPLVPKDSPLWYVLLALTVFLAITVAIMRVLERKQIYLRL